MDLQFSSRTFLAAESSYAESPAIIIGLPLDITSSFRPGTRFGPQAIRDCSWGLETYSPPLDRDLEELKICDVGDMSLPQGDLERALENMKKVAAASAEVDLNTGVAAYLRMGQIYDMTHRRAEALEAYRKAIAYAPQAEAAQESKKYLSTPYRRM